MKRTDPHGSRGLTRHRAGGISTVFALIGDVIADRYHELAARRSHQPESSGCDETTAEQLENPAAEYHVRMLELVELANRISILGFERSRQPLNLTTWRGTRLRSDGIKVKP